MKRLPRIVWIEIAITVAVTIAAGVWATRFWNEWVRRGGAPQYYQVYFEPAVMIACGHGFVVSTMQQPPAVKEFLEEKRDAIACSDIPGGYPLGSNRLYQRPWRYLMYYVGWSWRVLGISWRGMGPAFGFLFGVSMALVYWLGRLVTGRLAAIGVVTGLSLSTSHLLNLPHLRDYAKEPFSLALFLILGLLVTRRATLRGVAILGAVYGAILGIAYGFRTDFLIDIPLFLIVLALFVGPLRSVRIKAAGAAAFAAAFLVTGWPILSSVYRDGGCQWHVVLLGLTTPYDEPLHIAPAVYDFGSQYSDGYVAQTIFGYAVRAGQSPTFKYCSHGYDVASAGYLSSIGAIVPGDLITRAVASVLRILELPFSVEPPLERWHERVYEARERLLAPLTGWSVYVVAIALLIAFGASIRLGLFTLFFVLFVGGYPALQFHPRHHFHLEFIAWIAAAFVVSRAAVGIWTLRTTGVTRVVAMSAGRRMAVAAATVALAIGALAIARSYQDRKVARLMRDYLAAPKEPVNLADRETLKHRGEGRPGYVDYLSVNVDLSECGPVQAVTFRYDVAPGEQDFTRTFRFRRLDARTGTATILYPAFAGFAAVEAAPARERCIAGVSRVLDVTPFPVLLNATLLPDWERRSLHQTLADWERTAPFVPMPAPSTWQSTSGQTRTTMFGSLVVKGDAKIRGYQFMSPPVVAPEAAAVVVRTDFARERGKSCIGALNFSGRKWLFSAIDARRQLSFTVDDSGGFRVVVADCGPPNVPIEFSLSRAEYSID